MRAVMTLTEFLRARLDEDEMVARSAVGGGFTLSSNEPLSGDRAAAALGWVDHAKRWQPARVLAEVEAKRQILAAYEAEWPRAKKLYRDAVDRADALEECVEALTLPYADHPDYRDEWRP